MSHYLSTNSIFLKLCGSQIQVCSSQSRSLVCRCWLSITSGLIWTFIGPALTVVLVGLFLLSVCFNTFHLKANKKSKTRTLPCVRFLNSTEIAS